MNELLTVNANFHAVWEEGTKILRPQVEVIVVVSEPTYTLDAVGDIIRQRATSQFRFSANPKMLRRLADSLVKLADEADALPPLPAHPCRARLLTFPQHRPRNPSSKHEAPSTKH
jgi:hypothetical protein